MYNSNHTLDSEKNIIYGHLLSTDTVPYIIPLDTQWLRETVSYYKLLGFSLEKLLEDVETLTSKKGFQPNPETAKMAEDAKRLFQI